MYSTMNSDEGYTSATDMQGKIKIKYKKQKSR